MTTKTTHFTPGPWVVHTFTISGKEKLEVLDATGTNACVQANAHLIAAAPAMYEALQQTLFLVELAALEEWGRNQTEGVAYDTHGVLCRVYGADAVSVTGIGGIRGN